MHHKSFVHLFLFMLISMLLAGCGAQTMLQPERGPAGPAAEIKAPPRHVVDLDQVSPDIKLVLAGIMNKMQGDRDTIQGLRFDRLGRHQINHEPFMDQGFGLHFIDITGFTPAEVTEDSGTAYLEGFIHFKDFIGRRVSAYFATKYTATPRMVTILQSGTRFVPPYFPEIEAYYVPQHAFEEMPMRSFRTYTDLYLFAIANAVSMTPTEAERKDWEAFQKMSFWDKVMAKSGSKDDYYIMVFCMDWLPPVARLEMRVKDAPGASGQDIAEPAYLYWGNNWRVLVAGGEFTPDARGLNFYTTVTYCSDSNPENKPITVGVFTNQKNYAEAEDQAAPKAVVKKRERMPGPIEGGRTFLDPGNKEDARLIQNRLKALGFYSGRVDGLFGKNSRKALSRFATAMGFDTGSKWTPQVQKALFKDTGQ